MKKRPHFNCFVSPEIEELRNKLGSWIHGESGDFSELVGAVMQLCNVISKQSQEIKILKEESARSKRVIGYLSKSETDCLRISEVANG